MNPQLLNRSNYHNRSISFEIHEFDHFLKVWHYHPELELVLIKKSTGTRFIGDNVEKFQPNELFLLGENLPHLWLNDEAYFQKDNLLKSEAFVIHFDQCFAGQDFFKMPEMIQINDMLNAAKRGIKFSIPFSKMMDEKLTFMLEMDEFDRLIEFIRLLKLMSREKDIKYISSISFVESFEISKNRKLANVYEYIIKNFRHPILLDHVARLANMNKHAFCRYFKKVNGKPLSQYINEIRIGYACKLLLEQHYNIAEIGYECGFNNLSNFNRQFKNITSFTPTEYLNQHFL